MSVRIPYFFVIAFVFSFLSVEAMDSYIAECNNPTTNASRLHISHKRKNDERGDEEKEIDRNINDRKKQKLSAHYADNVGFFQIFPAEVIENIFSYCKRREIIPISKYFMQTYENANCFVNYEIKNINEYFEKYIKKHNGEAPEIKVHTLGPISPFKIITDLDSIYLSLIDVEAMGIVKMVYLESELDFAHFTSDDKVAHLSDIINGNLEKYDVDDNNKEDFLPLMNCFVQHVLLSPIESLEINTGSTRYLDILTIASGSKRNSVKNLTLRGPFCGATPKHTLKAIGFIPYLRDLRSFTLDTTKLDYDLGEEMSNNDMESLLEIIGRSSIKDCKIIIAEGDETFEEKLKKLHHGYKLKNKFTLWVETESSN